MRHDAQTDSERATVELLDSIRRATARRVGAFGKSFPINRNVSAGALIAPVGDVTPRIEDTGVSQPDINAAALARRLATGPQKK